MIKVIKRTGGIIQRMIYIVRCRRFVKVIFDEQDRIDHKVNKGRKQFPLEKDCFRTFKKKYKRYANREIAGKTLTLAVGANFIDELKPTSDDKNERLAIKADGLRLMTFTGFINELAKSVNLIAPIILSSIALLVSLYAAFIKN